MDIVQKNSTPNSYRALLRREIGFSSRALQSMLSRRILVNITKNHHTEATYKTHQQNICCLQVHYPFAITNDDITMKLWCLETGRCKWTRRVTKLAPCYGLELFKDRVVWAGTGNLLHLNIKILNCHTGKAVAECRYPKLTRDRYLCGKQGDFFVARSAHIERRSLDTGKLIQRINSEKFISGVALDSEGPFTSSLHSSKDHLVHVFEGGIVVHNLNKEDRYQIACDFTRRQRLHTFFDGTCCFCATRWKQNDSKGERHFLDYHVFDLEKKSVALVYQSAFEKKLFWSTISAVVYKKWAYLGFSSGGLVAVDWVNLTHKTLSEEQVDFLKLQEDIVIIGTYPKCQNQPGTLKFWNARSLTLISEERWSPPYVKPVLSDGKVMLIKDASLVVRDYSIDESSS